MTGLIENVLKKLFFLNIQAIKYSVKKPLIVQSFLWLRCEKRVRKIFCSFSYSNQWNQLFIQNISKSTWTRFRVICFCFRWHKNLSLQSYLSCTVAPKCKSQWQKRNDNDKSKNTMAKEKTQRQKRNDNDKSKNTGQRENTTNNQKTQRQKRNDKSKNTTEEPIFNLEFHTKLFFP